MKRSRLSLEIVTSPVVTRPEVANLLGVSPSALTEERVRRSTVWQYQPSTGQTGKLADRVRQLANEVHVAPSLPGSSGLRGISLGIDVVYDTACCTVLVPLYDLLYGQGCLLESVPQLRSIDLTCHASCRDLTPSGRVDPAAYDPDPTREEAWKRYEEWTAAGRPRAPGASVPLVMNESQMRSRGKASRRADGADYIVSLNAISSVSASRSEVSDVLGLPPDAFVSRCSGDGAAWRCELEADGSVSLAERIRFLASAIQPRRPFDPDGTIDEIYLDVGVFWDIRKTEACSVRLPVPGLRSLVSKLFVLHAEITCYPCEEDEVGSSSTSS